MKYTGHIVMSSFVLKPYWFGAYANNVPHYFNLLNTHSTVVTQVCCPFCPSLSLFLNACSCAASISVFMSDLHIHDYTSSAFFQTLTFIAILPWTFPIPVLLLFLCSLPLQACQSLQQWVRISCVVGKHFYRIRSKGVR